MLDINYEVIESFLEDTIDKDNGERRALFLDEDSSRIYWNAHELDFDRDDNVVKKYYLDEVEGYDNDWYDEIIDQFLL